MCLKYLPVFYFFFLQRCFFFFIFFIFFVTYFLWFYFDNILIFNILSFQIDLGIKIICIILLHALTLSLYTSCPTLTNLKLWCIKNRLNTAILQKINDFKDKTYIFLKSFSFFSTFYSAQAESSLSLGLRTFCLMTENK